MPYIDGEQVSGPAFTVLSTARKRGVRFYLTDGRRTMSEQWARYRHYKRYGWPVAAYPSPTAPHIRRGRDDHAWDVNTQDGGAERLDNFCTREGRSLLNTVRGEPWHKEFENEASLHWLARKLERADDEPVIRKGSKNERAIRSLQKLLRSLNVMVNGKRVKVTGKYGIQTRRAVRRFQKKHGLFVDGTVGPKTWRAIRRATNK